MRRLVIVLCLAAGLLAQGFALAGQMAALARGGDAAHAVMHVGGVAHHHEKDGSIHQDGSKQSLKHLQADCCLQLAGLLAARTSVVPHVSIDSSPAEACDHGHDCPFLEGLKRPPR